MGAGVSAGKCNDDLVDNLMEADYIKTSLVEKVFRAVDRGAYFLQEPPMHAYRDVAWKHGNLHISAPCIYSVVMEGLKLEPGLSFLNLGSGTGYFSTMIGLLLGSNGINHGIEYYEEVVEYANQKLRDFKKHSGAMDEFDFCEPHFLKGNCLSLVGGEMMYDRIYCGAACPEQYLDFMKSLIKPDGILIVPINDQLLKLTRSSETEWKSRSLLPVSFATLVRPADDSPEIRLFDIVPLSLQEICRCAVRKNIRMGIEKEYSIVQEAGKRKKPLKKKKKKDNDRHYRNPDLNLPPTRATDEFFDYFLLHIAQRNNTLTTPPSTRKERNCSSDTIESDSDSDVDPVDRMHDVFLDIIHRFSKKPDGAQLLDDPTSTEEGSETERPSCSKEEEISTTTEETETEKASCSQDETMTEDTVPEGNVTVHRENTPEEMMEIEETQRSSDIYIETNRDSGLGDDLMSEVAAFTQEVMSSEDELIVMAEDDADDNPRKVPSPVSDSVITTTTSSEDEEEGKTKWRRLDGQNMNAMNYYVSPYTCLMERKIEELPLPYVLKKYLHLYREYH